MAKQTQKSNARASLGPIIGAFLFLMVLGGGVYTNYRLTAVAKELSRINETCNHNVTDMRNSVKQVETNIQAQKESLTGLEERTRGLTNQMSNLEGQLDKLGASMQKNFTEVLNRLPTQ